MISPFEGFHFSPLNSNFSPIARVVQTEEEILAEIFSPPVGFDPPPAHPTTPVNEFAVIAKSCYNTPSQSELDAIDSLLWASPLFENGISNGFLPSSTDVSGFEPSSSSVFSGEGSLGSDLMELTFESNDFVPPTFGVTHNPVHANAPAGAGRCKLEHNFNSRNKRSPKVWLFLIAVNPQEKNSSPAC